MIKDYLQHLGLQYLRQEGSEYIYECPWCRGPKFYVNQSTGAWQCFRGCGEGYPYHLAQKLTGLQPKQIFELLEKYGLNTGDGPRDVPQKAEPKKKTLMLKREDVRQLTEEELQSFCQIKQLDPAALKQIRPFAHTTKPWVLLPGHDPEDMSKACGWIRVGIDGSLVQIKYKDSDGKLQAKEEKYPVVAGTTPGLLGLHSLANDTTDTIIYAEGWKDCVAALQLGLPTVANTNGAGKWRNSWGKAFKGKNVYVIGDCDAAGVRGAEKFADKVFEYAKEVYLVQLPYPADSGADLHDYIVRDKHTLNDLQSLLTQAQRYSRPSPGPEPVGAVVLPDDHPDTIAEAFEAWSIQQCKVKHHYQPCDGWTIFKDDKYQQVDAKSQVSKYLSKYLRSCWYKQGQKKLRVKLSNRKLGDVISQLSFLDDVYLRPKQAAPCSLSGTLDTKHTIALQNGLLDWSTYPYKLHNSTEDYYTLNYLPFGWQGEIDSELWINFLVDVTGGNEDLFELLQQWAGYCLMQHNQDEQRFMICFGEGGTGKSVFVDVLTHLLGRENVAAIPLEKFDDPHYVVQTYGKMLNVTDESESQLEDAVESHVKHYTGGTVYTFKRLYQEPFTAYPTAKLMIVTNHLPAFKDTSDGVWRRLLIAPFDQVIPEDKRVRGLSRKIIETEMPGVLKWALEGARKVEKYGFIVPEICKDIVENYRREAVPEMAFFEEHFEVEPDFAAEGVRCDLVRSAYERWCKQQGIGIKSQKKLGRTIRKLFPLSERKRGRDGSKLTYLYTGFRMRSDSEYAPEVTW